MRIGDLTNGRSCEFAMQEHFKQWLIERGHKFVDEHHVPEVKRRADFLVFVIGGGLINIEAKCNDFACMMKQLDDHATYCDYSFAFIPDYSLTPKWFKKQLAEKGYGLIVYNYNSKAITEVFEAHSNKPGYNNPIRRRIVDLIMKPIKQPELNLEISTQ